MIYPSRVDLYPLRFWNCAECRAYVGCHKKGAWFYEGGKKIISDGSIPLGRLANAALRKLKQQAHAAFDPVWRNGGLTRVEAYSWLAGQLGVSAANCHIGMMDEQGCQAVVHVMRSATPPTAPR